MLRSNSQSLTCGTAAGCQSCPTQVQMSSYSPEMFCHTRILEAMEPVLVRQSGMQALQRLNLESLRLRQRVRHAPIIGTTGSDKLLRLPTLATIQTSFGLYDSPGRRFQKLDCESSHDKVTTSHQLILLDDKTIFSERDQ